MHPFQQIQFKNPKAVKQDVVENLVDLMEYFGWSWEEVRDLPIPTLLEIMRCLSKKNKKGEKGKVSPRMMKGML